MVLVLAGMLGYLYWQQNKLMKAFSSLHTYVQRFNISEPEPEPHSEPEAEPELQPQSETIVLNEDSDSDSDDDSHVEHQPEIVTELIVVLDVDDLQTMTTPQLRELLNKKGIPYGKRDSKTVLLELLKASS
jgi:beta-lactam-binding protein with PASTA domain